MTESFLKSVGSAFLWQSLDKLTGLIKHVTIAATIGLSAQLDIFYMAIALLGVLVFSWANMLDIVAVPSMVKSRSEGRGEELKQTASGIFSLSLVIGLLLAILLYLSSNILTVIAIGFEPERKQMLADAIPWLLPVIFLYIPFRLIGSVLRARRQFSSFYQAEFFIALLVLICVLLFRHDDHVLLWSFSVGVTVAFLYILVKAWRLVVPLTNPFSYAVRQALQLAPGLLILQGGHYMYVFTDRVFVSFLPQGAISALAYGMVLVSLLPSLFSMFRSFITVLSESHSEPKKKTMLLNQLISMVILLTLGATCFLLFAGEPMIRVLLERGLFDANDTKMVGHAVSAYAWMILPIFLIGLLDQLFMVEHRVGLMVQRTILGMLSNIILNAWFLFGLGWGIFGIALATSISYWIMLLSGLFSLKQLGYTINWSQHFKWTLWLCSPIAVLYIAWSVFPFTNNGLLLLFSSSTIIVVCLLFAGIIYPGDERKLVQNTLRRCMPTWLKL